MNAQARIRHHFTVDVEEYFHVSALAPYIPRDRWEAFPRRVELEVSLLLDLLSQHDTRGTFFILGWVAERAPNLVRDIAAQGHEIASHGTDHRPVTDLTADQFRESVRRSKLVLENTIGTAVFGYRAPSFSILRGGEWALEILVEEGYRYDSSLFPVRRNGSGYVDGKRDPHRLELASGILEEIPPATLRFAHRVFPAGGGGYFRHLPYGVIKVALEQAEERGAAATFYIHPWEVDPGQPRIDVPFLTRLRHYGGLRRTIPRLQRLLSNFRFQPIAATLGLPYTPVSSQSKCC
jgi:polysaccharide deacetylase family protein (PEP-CTERM system associated)